MINEAKKRGYNNENTICLLGLKKEEVTGSFYYNDFENRLYSNTKYRGGKILFENGKWATIIETITIQEAEKLLKEQGINKKIV